jgi:HSP20 family protein
MNLIKFDPYLRRNQTFPSVFNDFFNGSIADFVGGDFATNMPSVNISETEQGFQLELAAPGLAKEDFKIAMDKDRLTVSAERSMKNENKEGTFTRREFNYSSFSRTFVLPKTVDKDRISAKYENGLLMLTVPKKAEIVKEEKSRIIEIG